MLDLILTSQNLYCRKEFVITSFDGYRVFNCNTYILTSHDIHVVSVSFTSGHAYNSSSSLIPSFSCTKKKKINNNFYTYQIYYWRILFPYLYTRYDLPARVSADYVESDTDNYLSQDNRSV